jgi:hypothetical protein
MLDGRVNTPLFRRGGSSWHEREAAFVRRLREKDIAFIALIVVAGVMLSGMIIRWCRNAHRREKALVHRFEEKLV